MKRPQFELTRIYSDGSRDPPMIVPVSDVALDAEVGRRSLFSAGLDAVNILRTMNLGERSAAPAIVLNAHERAVSGISFTPDGRYLLSASLDTNVKVWDLGGRAIHRLSQPFPVNDIAVSPAGDYFLTDDGQAVRMFSLGPSAARNARQAGRLEVDRDGITTVTNRKTAIAPPLAKPTLLRSVGAGSPILFGANGKLVVAGRSVYTLPTFTTVATLSSLDYTGRIAMSADGKSLAAARIDGVVDVLSLADNSRRYVVGTAGPPVNAIAFSRDGAILASAHADGFLRFWSGTDGGPLRAFRGTASAVKSLQFTPDGAKFVCGSVDKSVKIFNASTYQVIKSLTGHPGEVITIAMAPGGKLVATGDSAGVIILWDLVNDDFSSYLFDPDLNSASAVTYSAVDSVTGQLLYFTLPCGSPIPAGATCVCNCVAGTRPQVPSTPAPKPGGGGTICTCNLICTCDLICTCNLVFR